MSYRIWWRWNDGLSGHIWLSADDLRRLTEEMLTQGMPWPSERLSATETRDVVVTPQELEVVLETASAEPVALRDSKLWQEWLAFLEEAVHKGGILIRA